MEVHGLRRVDDGEVRRHGDEVSAGTLFTHLDPALAKAGPLPSTNNMIEGGVNSQPGADVGQAREGGVPVVPRALGGREDGAREARHDADRRGHRLLFSVYSASPSREDGGPEWGDRAVWEDLHHRDPYPFWLD